MIKIKVFEVHDDAGQARMDAWLAEHDMTYVPPSLARYNTSIPRRNMVLCQARPIASPGKEGACFRNFITLIYDERPVNLPSRVPITMDEEMEDPPRPIRRRNGQ